MPRSINRMAFWCGLLILSAAADGCQRKQTSNLAPVEGTITKNGRPLRGIEVVFRPDLESGTQGLRTKGITDEAGHYRLRTDNGEDGAVMGKYRVVLLDARVRSEQMGRTAAGSQPKGKTPLPPEMVKLLEKPTADAPQVPPLYGRFNDTPLRVEILPGPQVIDLDVK